MSRLLTLSGQPMLDILSTPLHTPSYLVTCLGLLRVRPHPPAAYIGYSPVLVPNSLVPSTPGALTWLPLQLMDRDPLHDSVLDDAADDGEASEESSTTPMTRAERSDPTPPPVGLGPFGPPVPTPVGLFMPSGPPAPMPFSREVAQQTTLSLLGGRGERSSASAAGTGVGVPNAVHLGPLTGWQRQLALQSSSSCT